jgi:hypothetical protein
MTARRSACSTRMQAQNAPTLRMTTARHADVFATLPADGS